MATVADAKASTLEKGFIRRRSLARVVAPLRAIFWGGLLCIFDFNLFIQVGKERQGFDVLNDGLGMVLVAGGVIVLAAQEVDSLYDWLMSSTSAVAVVFMVGSFLKQLEPELFLKLQTLMPLFRIMGFVSTVAFCIAMMRLSAILATPAIERSWRTTTLLFATCVLAPGVILAVVFFLFPQTKSLLIYSWPLLLPGAFFALVHFFVSTSRMSTFAHAQEPKAPQRSVL